MAPASQISTNLLIRRPAAAGPAVVRVPFALAGRPAPDAPRVWLLTEGRAGDDHQLVSLADALGWPYEVVRLQGNTVPGLIADRFADLVGRGARPHRLPNPEPRTWPDLVLAIGGASVSTARRIRRASGGRTCIAQLGRPVARLSTFDLVVTTPQYGLPNRPNVVRNVLPIGQSAASRPDDIDPWRERFADLPRPWVALLVGGPSGSYRLDSDSVEPLARRAEAAVAGGGSLLVSTSPRTPRAVAVALERRLAAPHFFHHFVRGAPGNPYPALLALADRFLVTGESASLLSDAHQTGRPVEALRLEPRWLSRVLLAGHRRALRVARPAVEALTSVGGWVPPRDLEALHSAYERQREGAAGGLRPTGDTERAVVRIRALLSERTPSTLRPARPAPAARSRALRSVGAAN